MEEHENKAESSPKPVLSCKYEVTESLVSKINRPLQKISRVRALIHIVAGLILVAFSAVVIIKIRFSGYREPLAVLICGCLGGASVANGAFLIYFIRLTPGASYAQFRTLNRDPVRTVDFFREYLTIKTKQSSETYYYVDAVFWGESELCYYLFFGSGISRMKIYVPKYAFNGNDRAVFVSLMNEVLYGKECRDIK